MTRYKIAIITTSTRTPRVGPKVAALVSETLKKDAADQNIELSSIDLADFNLPIFDEPNLPAMVPTYASHAHEHSIAWSNEIKKYDAYILVIPEYNYGMAGSTKNAVDYLYHEWTGKPAGIISYGIFGGSLASEQLNGVLTGVKLRLAPTRPALAFFGNRGPDMEAAFKGELGDASKKDWVESKGLEIKRLLSELVELASQTPE